MKSLKQLSRDLMGAIFSIPADFLGGGVPPSEAGVLVNEMTSMQVGAVTACIRIISQAVSTLPFGVYERLPNGGARLAPEHPLAPLVSIQPSPEYTACDFYSSGQVHALQTGNTYIEILRDGRTTPKELCLRSPFRTYPYREMAEGRNDAPLVYVTSDTLNGVNRKIQPRDMIHVKGMGVDPYSGMSPIKFFAREAIGVALAAQAYGAKLFKNDSRPGGYLKTTKLLKPEEKIKNVNSWLAGHSGNNSHQVALLDGDLDWKAVGISPEEAQFLQTREFQRTEIGIIYGVPAHMLGSTGELKATIEQKSLEFLIWTLKPWLRRWEQAINSKLFATGKFFGKFDTAEYERADYGTMLKAIQTGAYAGTYSTDERRRLLGLNPTTAENFPEMTPADFETKKPGSWLWQPVNMATMNGETPDETADRMAASVPQDDSNPDGSGSSGGGSPNDPNPDSSPNPTDTGDGDTMRALLPLFWNQFSDALRRIKARDNAKWEDWQRTLAPIFAGIACAYLGPDDWAAELPAAIARCNADLITRLKGYQLHTQPMVRQRAELVECISAIVRAAKTHVSEGK